MTDKTQSGLDIDLSGLHIEADDAACVVRMSAFMDEITKILFTLRMARAGLRPQTYRVGSMVVAEARPQGQRQSAGTRVVKAARELEAALRKYSDALSPQTSAPTGQPVSVSQSTPQRRGYDTTPISGKAVYPRLLCMKPVAGETVICVQPFTQGGKPVFNPGDRMTIESVQNNNSTVWPTTGHRYVFVRPVGSPITDDPIQVRQSDMRFRILTKVKTLPVNAPLWDNPKRGDEVIVTVAASVGTEKWFVPGEKMYVLAVSNNTTTGQVNRDDYWGVRLRCGSSGVDAWVNAFDTRFEITRRAA